MELFTLGHRKALDGVRGLAILLVLAYHIPSLPLGGGFIGVDLFFVLSGFLITTLLLEEWRENGDLNLKAFYVRRTLRLLPALVVVLAAMVAVSALTEPPPASAAMRTSAAITLFYSANWFLAFRAYPRPELSATWSLSVEEQFYILWPALLWGMLRAGWSRRAILTAATLGMAASAVARAMVWNATGSFDRVMFGTDTHADGLLAGVVVALLVTGGIVPRSAGGVRALQGAALVVLACIGIFLPLGWSGDASMFLGGYVAVDVAAAVLVASLVTSPWAGLRAIFEWAPLVWLGRISYGVYLWHFAAPWILSRTGVALGRGYWPAAIGLTIAAAALSFCALEQPLLRVKRRFQRVVPEGRFSP